MPGDVARALAHDPEQFTQMPHALREELFLLDQLGFLTIEFGLQALGFCLLLCERGIGSRQQLRLLAAILQERLLTRLHGIGFGRTIATNALQQLIGGQGFGRLGQCRQQANEQQRQQTAHRTASLARVFTGNSSQLGACCWRAMAIALVMGRRALPSSTSQARVCGFHQPLS